MKTANLAVIFLLELAMLAAVAYWGFQATDSGLINVVLGTALPVLFIVVWARWMAPRSQTRLAGTSYVVVKSILFGIAALLLFFSGQSTLALIFVAVAVISQVLAILWKQTPAPR